MANVLQHVSCTSRRFQPGGVASGVDNGQGQDVRNEFTSSTGSPQKGIRSALVMANVLQHVSCTSRRFQPGGVVLVGDRERMSVSLGSPLGMNSSLLQ
jgi:hypothetical protein